MNGSYRLEQFAIPLREGRRAVALSRLSGRIRAVRLPALAGQGFSVSRIVRHASSRAAPHLARLGPLARAHLTFLGVSVPEEQPAEPTEEQALLGAFEALDGGRQEAVARNLSLLWECFLEEFSGLSGFFEASPTRQSAYLDRLASAAGRMEASRAPEARYHYVSVALMKHYVSSFQARSTAPDAIALSRRVASLIDGTRTG